MANRTFDKPMTLGKGIVKIEGSFAPAGTSAPTAVKGKGFSVSRSGVGTFVVLLEDAYVDLNCATASLQLASADDKTVQFGAIDVVTAKTVVLRVYDISGAAAADISADPANRVHFSLTLKNSTV